MSTMTISSKFLTAVAIVGGTVLAGLTSGFTEAANVQLEDLVRFQYEAPQSTPTNPDPYSQANVETLTNWQYAPSDPGCSAGNIKPCIINVSEDYVQGSPQTTYTLDPSFVITASNDSIAHVTGTSDGIASDYFTNRGLL